MHKCINGWTKEKMLEVVKARKFDEACMNATSGLCVYENADGNRCAVGLFIPAYHDGLDHMGGVVSLCEMYPDLKSEFPLEGFSMIDLQFAHDHEQEDDEQKFNGNAKAAMLDWIEKNVAPTPKKAKTKKVRTKSKCPKNS